MATSASSQSCLRERTSSFRGIEEASNPRQKSTSLSASQRVFLGVGSAFLSILDPHRGDLIATLAETTATDTQLRHLLKKMKQSEEGKHLLQNRVDVNEDSVRFNELASLPDTSFGKHYHEFMSGYHYSPDERTPVRFIEDPELAYVMQRYRQTHDFVHVLVGVPTCVLGELAVKVCTYDLWIEMGLVMSSAMEMVMAMKTVDMAAMGMGLQGDDGSITLKVFLNM